MRINVELIGQLLVCFSPSRLSDDNGNRKDWIYFAGIFFDWFFFFFFALYLQRRRTVSFSSVIIKKIFTKKKKNKEKNLSLLNFLIRFSWILSQQNVKFWFLSYITQIKPFDFRVWTWLIRDGRREHLVKSKEISA